jgi:hypothetical protein
VRRICFVVISHVGQHHLHGLTGSAYKKKACTFYGDEVLVECVRDFKIGMHEVCRRGSVN